MDNDKRDLIEACRSKPIEKMSPEERDNYFLSFSGLTYDEFNEKHKNDTFEDIHKSLIDFIESHSKSKNE